VAFEQRAERCDLPALRGQHELTVGRRAHATSILAARREVQWPAGAPRQPAVTAR
jgi:hypothetical protein